MANLVILEPAQRELEEIAQLHMNLVGPNSARNITDLILDTLSRLEMFPLSGHIPQDKELRNGGYRYVIAGKYICVKKSSTWTLTSSRFNFPLSLISPFSILSKVFIFVTYMFRFIVSAILCSAKITFLL